MSWWRLASSGGKNYTIQGDDNGVHVRKNDGFFWRTGSDVGYGDNLREAADLIKSDSGSSSADIGRKR